MKVVLDTNVILSGLNFPGKEREVLELARLGRYQLYLSPFILGEAAGVLQRKFGWSAQRTEQAMLLLRSWATVVRPKENVSVIERDDADNRVLECALEAGADFLVTGDRRDLLPLKEFKGTRIVPSSEFLAVLDLAR